MVVSLNCSITRPKRLELPTPIRRPSKPIPILCEHCDSCGYMLQDALHQGWEYSKTQENIREISRGVDVSVHETGSTPLPLISLNE